MDFDGVNTQDVYDGIFIRITHKYYDKSLMKFSTFFVFFFGLSQSGQEKKTVERTINYEERSIHFIHIYIQIHT